MVAWVRRALWRITVLMHEMFSLVWVPLAWAAGLHAKGARRRPRPHPPANGRSAASAAPRVLFVMERWCDCDPERGPTNSAHNLCGSLEASGLADQRCFFYDRYTARTGRPSDVGLIREIARRPPSVLVVTVVPGPWRHPSCVSFWIIRHILRIPLVFVWFDFANTDVLRKLACLYSHLATTSVVLDAPEDVAGDPSYRRRFLPLWTPQDPRIFGLPETNRPRDIDVCFLGSRSQHPDRQQLLQRLRELPIRLLEGGGQREQRLPVEEYADLLRRSKIVINFSRALGRSPKDQVKGRVFEATLCGAMLLEMRNRQTPHWLDPEADYAEYQGADDLVARVEWFLRNDADRERIARRGCARAHALYTAERFWETVFARTISDVRRPFRAVAVAPEGPACVNTPG
ncbi:MAG: glycosyltransferase [Deltaproteobacteria bacterium]